LVSAQLGSGLKSTTQLFLWGSFKSIFDNPGISPRKPILIRFKEKEYDYYFRNYSDFGLAFEILIQNSYQLDKEFCDNPKHIVDLGANSGISAIYLNSLYPDATVHCYEPDPHTFSQLQLNTSRISNIFGHQEVVSDTKGHIEFLADPKSNVTSSIIRRNSRQVPISVKSRCLYSVLDKIGDSIDLLKVDIEGSEEIVFRNFDDYGKIKNLIGELHFDLCNAQLVLEKLQQNYENIQIYPVNADRCYVIASSPVDRLSFNLGDEIERSTTDYLVDQAV
jgi:FkbM family methyltransferase